MGPEGQMMPLTSQVRTRESQAQVKGHTPWNEELIKLKKDMLSSTKQAHNYLENQGYMLKDAQGNKASLMYTLLLLVHCMPYGSLPRGIRAVATILEYEAAMKMADMVSTM